MKRNNKGFTLAELLIVVAIIAVLVAIAIPVFTSQLEKTRDATTVANLRSAYAEAAVKILDNTDTTVYTIEGVKSMGTQYGYEGNVDGGLPFDAPDGMGDGKGATFSVTFNFDDPDSVTCFAVKN